MNDNKLFTQRIGLISIANILLSFSSLLLLPVLTKNLSVIDYGVWVQFLVTISVIVLLSDTGLSYGFVRFLPAENDKTKIQKSFYSVLFLILFISLLFSIILYLFSIPYAIKFLAERDDIVRLISLIVPFVCLNGACFNFFRALQEIKKYVLIVLFQNYGVLVLAIFLLWFGYGIFEVILSYLFVQVITFIVIISFISSNIGFKFPTFKPIREYLKFGLPIVPGIYSSWIINASDRFLITFFLGVAFVGYYAPAYGVGSLIGIFVAPLGFLLPSSLSKLYDVKKYDEVRTQIKYSIKYFLILAIPSVFGLSFLSKKILLVLTTPEIALNGYIIVSILALTSLIYGIRQIISQIFIITNKTKIIGMIWIVAAIINIILNILLIPIIGIIGAAFSALISILFVFLLSTWYCYKLFSFEIDVDSLVKSICASILMLFVIFFYLGEPSTFINLLKIIVVCSVVYFVTIIITKGITLKELKFFREVIKI